MCIDQSMVGCMLLAGKNAIVAEMKDHHTTLESLQQAMKVCTLPQQLHSCVRPLPLAPCLPSPA